MACRPATRSGGFATHVRIGPHRTHTNKRVASFRISSGYREGDDSANVWETADGGESWKNISGNLPNAPVEMITYDQPGAQLYAATDFGVFYLKNGQKNWKRLGQGCRRLPCST